MIDQQNLRTASLYINNQLLSRGLLRDGRSIDFADPENGHGGSSMTMGRIISVVNDLILRRDRDAENRESLSATLRTLRAESLHHTDTIARLQDHAAESQRQLNLADVTESSLRSQLRTAEATIRALRDDVARARSNVVQSRMACATETRRRDRQIDVLKRQLADVSRARGTAKSNSATTVISVVPGEGPGERREPFAGSGADDDYDLCSETNGFLAELARSLSEENDQLLALIRQTKDRLRTMSGWDDARAAAADPSVVVTRPSYDDIAGDLDTVTEHLRCILTNPSFVPIEEVVVRDEEIVRLREGWVKMESRWKEAVHLIDGWRRRMASSGRHVNDEELKMGLRLSPVRVREVEDAAHGLGLRLATVREETSEVNDCGFRGSPRPPPSRRHAESLHLMPAPGYEEGERDDGEYDRDNDDDDDEADSSSSIFQEHCGDDDDDDGDGGGGGGGGGGGEDYHNHVELDELDVEEPNVQILQQSTLHVEPLPPPKRPGLGPLQDSPLAGNGPYHDLHDDSELSNAPSTGASSSLGRAVNARPIFDSLKAPRRRAGSGDFSPAIPDEENDTDATLDTSAHTEPLPPSKRPGLGPPFYSPSAGNRCDHDPQNESELSGAPSTSTSTSTSTSSSLGRADNAQPISDTPKAPRRRAGPGDFSPVVAPEEENDIDATPDTSAHTDLDDSSRLPPQQHLEKHKKLARPEHGKKSRGRARESETEKSNEKAQKPESQPQIEQRPSLSTKKSQPQLQTAGAKPGRASRPNDAQVQRPRPKTKPRPQPRTAHPPAPVPKPARTQARTTPAPSAKKPSGRETISEKAGRVPVPVDDADSSAESTAPVRHGMSDLPLPPSTPASRQASPQKAQTAAAPIVRTVRIGGIRTGTGTGLAAARGARAQTRPLDLKAKSRPTSPMPHQPRSPRVPSSPRLACPSSPKSQIPSFAKSASSPPRQARPAPASFGARPATTQPSSPEPATNRESTPPPAASCDFPLEDLPPSPSSHGSHSSSESPESKQQRSPARVAGAAGAVTSRLPLPRPPVPVAFQQSPLTMAAIAAKLLASEREADAARVRAKLRAARMGGRKPATAAASEPGVPGKTASVDFKGEGSDSVKKGGSTTPKRRTRPFPVDDAGSEDELARDDADVTYRPRPSPSPRKSSPRKKREQQQRVSAKVANRRRSTLNPWELRSLISGSADVPPVPDVPSPAA